MQKTYLTKEQALQKLKHYCGYQERCHSEVISKLYDLGVYKNEHDEILSTLIQENYLNEERFAIQFVGGKFRLKHWGKIKIKYELKSKQISEYCIKKALLIIYKLHKSFLMQRVIYLKAKKISLLKKENCRII